MDCLPKLDTGAYTTTIASADYSPSNSARNSYASATGSHRSSYASTADSDNASLRTSLSPFESPQERESPGSMSRWSDGEIIVKDDNSTPETENPGLPSRPVVKDGPTALRELENVRNVMCVAFGAFDRYYISWEDNYGELHQEGSKLPSSLHEWLFPPNGRTRHLPTLQVSFGSNDDFFASDVLGKVSSRDSAPSAIEKKQIPRLASVARDMMKRNSYKVSAPTLPEANQSVVETRPETPNLARRTTLLEGLESPKLAPTMGILPVAEHQLKRWSSRAKQRSRAISNLPIPEANQPISLNTESSQPETRPSLEVPASPISGSVSIPPPVVEHHSERMGTVVARQDEYAAPCSKPPSPSQATCVIPEPVERIMEIKSEVPSLESRESLLDKVNNSDTLLKSAFQPSAEQEVMRPKPRAKTLTQQPIRNILFRQPIFRSSWPDRGSIVTSSSRIGVNEEPRALQIRSNYVDSGMQTEAVETEGAQCLKLVTTPAPFVSAAPSFFAVPRYSMSMGLMSDFCRGQYSLGDALRYV